MYYKDGTEITFNLHADARNHVWETERVALPGQITDKILAAHGILPEDPGTQPVGEGTIKQADSIFIDGVLTQQWTLEPYTDSELKMIGIEFTDATGTNPDPMMLSAMAEDQWGLESVRRNVMAGLTVNYLFENGNILILNSANFDAMEAVWLPFRASFFQ